MVIWVMGGPGSSKTEKMEDIAAQHPEWRLIDVSKLVWNFLSQGGNSIRSKTAKILGQKVVYINCFKI